MLKILKVIELVLLAILFFNGVVTKEYQWCYIGLLLMQSYILMEILEKINKKEKENRKWKESKIGKILKLKE